jgi:hypothetical protein
MNIPTAVYKMLTDNGFAYCGEGPVNPVNRVYTFEKDHVKVTLTYKLTFHQGTPWTVEAFDHGESFYTNTTGQEDRLLCSVWLLVKDPA